MTELLTIYGLLLVSPFLLGYIHQRQNNELQPVVVYYRYFMFFNMIIAGLFVAAQVFMAAKETGTLLMWAYHSAFDLYGIAILSMVFMGVLTVFSRKKIMLAPAICWSVFLLLSTLSQVVQITEHKIANTHETTLQLANNVLVAMVLIGFLYFLKNYFREGVNQRARAANS